MTATQSTETLTVLENGETIEFSFSDLQKYHGFGYPGGVAHAFKVMQRVFPLLDGGTPPERHELRLDTPFPGPGARDAFEMVTRMVTSGRYVVHAHVDDADPIRNWMGKYHFRWSYRGKTVVITIRPGHVREEFIRLAGMAVRSEAEEARLVVLKNEMADRLMRLPAAEIYDASLDGAS